MAHRSGVGTALMAAVIGLGLVGCGEDFDPSSLVADLRVLAIEADPPHIPLAGTSALSALTHTPGSEIAYTWSACLVGLNTSQGFQCADEAFNCALGEEATATLNPVELFATCLAGSTLPDEFAELLGLDSGELSQEDIEQLFSEEQTVTVTLSIEAGDERVDAIKRVTVGGEAPFNANPAIDRLVVDGAEWPEGEVLQFDSQQLIEMDVVMTDESRETYTDSDGVEAEEEFFFAWFATDGDVDGNFSNDLGSEKNWRAPEVLAGSPEVEVTLWLVARDGRGGTDSIERQALVQPAPEEAE